jgi:hypothetical protein
LAFAGLVATAVLTIAACGTSTSSGGVAGATGSPATSGSPSASASAEASASPSGSAPLKQAFLQFKEANGSGITGGAILTDLGNSQTAVTIGVVAAGVTDPMPSSLVPGECTTLATGGGPSASAGASAAASAAPSAPASAAASGSPEPSGSAVPLTPGSLIKLGDLSAGSSNTVVNIGLDGLTSQPYAVVIYKSAKDQSVVACADVKM